MIHLHKYRATENLGDAIQTIAAIQCLDRVLPKHEPIGFVERDQPPGPVERALVNGFLDRRWRWQIGRNAFCGVHCADAATAARVVAATSYPIGARDPYTRDLLLNLGADASFIGCATLTFPRYYTGPRAGLWSVDCTDVVGATALTHKIPADLSWEHQIELAYRMLSRYESAEAVWTSRLHVLLPCIAFGTPVCLTHVPCPNRFGIAEVLGVKPGGSPRTYDCADLARLYEIWLSDSFIRLS